MPRLFVLAALLSVAPAAAAPSEEPQVWAGHEVVLGTRHIPVLGDLETRADSYLLARVHFEGGVVVLEQRPCAFAFKEVLGVQVALSPETVARMPATTVRFAANADGTLTAGPWTVGWGDEDIDGDGQPGASIQVTSALCSGQIHVSTRATTTVLAERVDDALAGSVQVETTESVLGASKWCLRFGASERTDVQSGTIRYTRVAPTTTCEDLSVESWPVQADEAEPAVE